MTMVQPTDFAVPYNQGYRDGEKAARERQKAVEALSVPVCYVGSPEVLEEVITHGRHNAVLMRDNLSRVGVPLFASQAAADTCSLLSLNQWRVINSLECTVKWLENGRDVDEATEELRKNLTLLRQLKA